MKTILTIIFTIAVTTGFCQITKMVQVKDQTFQMNGVQNGQPVEKMTKVFGLTINYETGELNGVVNLVDIDLLNKNRESSSDPEEDALKIRGFLPLNDILYNEQNQRTYTVELELRIKDFTVTSLFNFDIVYAKNTLVDFHNVRATSNVNLLDFKVEDLNGFEPDVTVILMFQMLRFEQ